MVKLNDAHIYMLIKRHYYWLDMLRALAMLAVGGGHYRNVLFPPYSDVSDSSGLGIQILYALTKCGHSAVIVFFVLSGFLVGGKALERAIRNEFDITSYALNRIERIMVPLLLMCALIPLVFSMLGIPVPWGEVVGNLVSMQGVICKPLLGPWWALSVEVWFYTFCGAVLGLWKCRKWMRVISGMLLLAVILAFTKGFSISC